MVRKRQTRNLEIPGLILRVWTGARAMVNRVLTSPYLWWFDRGLSAGVPLPAALKVLAFQTWQ
jgi:hypothetical protein